MRQIRHWGETDFFLVLQWVCNLGICKQGDSHLAASSDDLLLRRFCDLSYDRPKLTASKNEDSVQAGSHSDPTQFADAVHSEVFMSTS